MSRLIYTPGRRGTVSPSQCFIATNPRQCRCNFELTARQVICLVCLHLRHIVWLPPVCSYPQCAHTSSVLIPSTSSVLKPSETIVWGSRQPPCAHTHSIIYTSTSAWHVHTTTHVHITLSHTRARTRHKHPLSSTPHAQTYRYTHGKRAFNRQAHASTHTHRFTRACSLPHPPVFRERERVQ